MDLGKLNRLIERVMLINHHLADGACDPLLEESLVAYITEIKLHYGSFLLDKLFDIYDDYFSDDEIKSIEFYLTDDGVEVEGDDFQEIQSRLSIRPFPLRIEVRGAQNTFAEVIWQAA